MPSLTADINPKSDLHRRICSEVRDRITASKTKVTNKHKKWKEAEERAQAYLPEREVDAQKRVLREDGKPQYTTIQIPYSYAVLMASHTYWTTVFMSRDPVLQFAGRHGESEQQTQALEALLGYQTLVGEMLVPWYIWLMDVGKYGVGIIGMYWEEESSMISEIIEREEMFLGILPTGKMKKRKVSRRVAGYVGNKIYNVRPFDFFPDPRVTLANFQKGEFCGVYNELSWSMILRREEQGYYTNIERLKVSYSGGTEGQREEGSGVLELPETDHTLSNDDGKRKTKGPVVPIYECVIDLIPKAWGLGQSNMPEKWVFTVTDKFDVVIGAQPLGANHNKFPYQVLEFEPEGYALFNRGIPEILDPIQNTLDWLINTHFYNVRKSLNDQFVVDPSRVVMGDLLDPLPGGIIRLKPTAYGTDPHAAVQQLQVQDVTRAHLSDMQTMFEIGSRTIGVNEQILGALQQGGRKTATEVRTSSTFGINRLKTTAEYFSAMGWGPMSQMMVQNSQQYYEADLQFRILGDLAQEAGPQFINVTPESIRGFYDFVPVDGTLPIDRFAQANLWREMFGQLRNFPQIMQQYDIGRIFAWVAQLAGLKNINQFKIQVVPDEMAAQQAQLGNVVPMPAGQRDLTRVPEPGQVSGLGTTG